MATLQERLEDATASAEGSASLLHNIVHGDATTEVVTEGGTVKSLAKAVADLEADYAGNGYVVSAQTAEANAEGHATTAAEDAQTCTDKVNEVTALVAGLGKPSGTRIQGGTYVIVAKDHGKAFEMKDGSSLTLPPAVDTEANDVDEPFRFWVDASSDFDCTISPPDAATIEDIAGAYVLGRGSSVMFTLDEYMDGETKMYNWNIQVFGSGAGEFTEVGTIRRFIGSVPTSFFEITDTRQGKSKTEEQSKALHAKVQAMGYPWGSDATTFNIPSLEDIGVSGRIEVLEHVLTEFAADGTNAGATFSEAHGLPGAPTNVKVELVCTTAGDGYAVDEVLFAGYDAQYSGSNDGCNVSFDDTYLNVQVGSAGRYVIYTESGAAYNTAVNATARFNVRVTAEYRRTIPAPSNITYGIKAFNNGITPTNVDLETLAAYNRLPVGWRGEIEGATALVHNGCLREDGREVSRTTHSALYALQGDKYGAGDGSSTFNLKNSIVTTQVPGSEGTAFGDMTNDGLTNLFDGNVDTSTYKPGFTSDGYAGKHYENAKKISSVALTAKGYGSYGFVTNESGSVTFTVDVYGSNTLPTSQTDGTIIGTYTGPDVIPGLEIACDSTTAYPYIWCAFSTNEANTLVSIAEIVFTEASEPTYIKASDVINETGGVSTVDVLNEVHELKARGGVIQTVHVQDGEANQTTAIIAIDDTLPQITEGAEFLSATITPQASTNILEVKVNAFVSSSVISFITGALFRDGSADAVAVGGEPSRDSAKVVPVTFTYRTVAGSTAPTTFSLRCGGLSGTTYFNRVDNGRVFGGLLASTITVTEYAQ